MRLRHLLLLCAFTPALAQTPEENAARALATLPAGAHAPAPDDPALILTRRLDLERYKATIKGLTRFGDRRQGTQRNRDALDWIEKQLKSYGCTNIQRITYQFGEERTHYVAPAATKPNEVHFNVGGARARGFARPTGVNTDASLQPDAKLRALNAPPAVPGERQDVYCTKVGATHPGEMYIVAAHMDGIGWGEAANDDGSGTALVMELARVFSSPDVHTERSIRFVLWNNEETGLNGASAYVAQRAPLQGKPDVAGNYPEPRWLGMIQHDMMMFDHGMPHEDGSVSKTQRPEADVNVDFQSDSKFAEDSQKLAWALEDANEHYASDYPASVGRHMTNTDFTPFKDLTAAISVRENERGAQVGNGWDPQWHQPTDLYSTYDDKDFRLGLNAAQTTLSAVANLAGATIKK